MKRQGLIAFALFFIQGINYCQPVPGPLRTGGKEKTVSPPALQQIRFEHLTVADGLTDNSVLDIMQDHLGFIWMGTLNGLVSYDGATITPFQYNPGNPNSLKGNIISALLEDKKGDIWVGSQSLFRFERSTQRFVEYPNKNIVNGGAPIVFRELFEDSTGNIWAIIINSNVNKSFLERLDPVSKTWTSFQNTPGNKKAFTGNVPKGEMVSYSFPKTGEIYVNFSGDNQTSPFRYNKRSGKLELINFKSDPNVKDAFNKMASNAIAVDKQGRVYYPNFNGKGLFVWNPATGQMVQYKNNRSDGKSLANDTVFTLFGDKSGNMWVSGPQGIDRYDSQTGEFFHYLSVKDNFSTPTIGYIVNAEETSQGNLWFSINGELNYYDRKTDQFLRYKEDSKAVDGLVQGYGISTVFLDRSGLLWACAQNSGVNKETRINHFSFISKDPGNKNSLLDSNVNAIYEAPSKPGIIWFGTNKGLSRFDKKTGKYTHYVHDDKIKNSLSKEQVNGMAEDSKGRFWVSTHQGLNLMDREKGTFTFFTHDPANANSLGHEHISCLKIAADGKIWMGTDAGVGWFDYDKNVFRHFMKADTSYTPELYHLINKYTSKDRQVAAILHSGNNSDKTIFFKLDQPQDLLVTALGSVDVQKTDWGWIEDAAGKTVWDMNNENTLSDGVSAIRSDLFHFAAGTYSLHYKTDDNYAYGNFNWVTTYHPELWGIQVTRLNAAEAKIFKVEASKRFYNGPGDNSVASLGEDLEGNIWIGTNSGGLSKYNPATGMFTNYMDPLKGPTSVPGAILQDHKTGNFWIGDYINGLLLMDKNGNILKRYNNTNGLSSNSIMGILKDAKGFLWVSTNNGITRFDPGTGKSQLFNKKHGLQDLTFNIGATFKTADGEFYFGGKNGVNAFYPGQVIIDTIPPQVALTGLLIGGKPPTLGKEGQMPLHISVAQNIEFDHHQNDLAFHYSTLLFNRGNESQFAYKLSPNDKDWIYAGTLREVRYTNLSPGKYTFTVKAANADGYWNETGTSFSFVILSPWWKTWWAYSLYFFIITGSVWYYIRNREKALKRRQKKLEATVAKRTSEVVIQKERAEQSEKFKQQFLANMSHEIRTPMNAVLGMTHLVLDTPLNEKQKFYMQGISRSGENLLHIINDILDLSKIESGKIELEHIDFSLNALLEQVKQLLQHKADEKGIELITDPDPKIPDILIGDPARINQVLINLAGNAIKFTEKGSVTLKVDPTVESNLWRFSVIDTGIGIPRDKLQTVFESFSQAHSSDTRKFGGTGLGLTITKQLVELMGGEIMVDSEEGAGSDFSFEIILPVGSVEKMIQQQSVEKVDGTILNGLAILIVDDNEYNRVVVHDILLSKAKVELSVATNGKEAVEMVSGKDFDVILMDVQMPVMDGYEATRLIRSELPSPKNKIPVIALTASVVRSDLDKCRSAGMNDYVPKPFKTTQLINAIAKATGRQNAHGARVSLQTDQNQNFPGKLNTAAMDLKGTLTDLNYLHQFCEGDNSKMQKYTRMFLDSIPILSGKLSLALENKDYETIANQVHGFKTRWIMMGMTATKDLAMKIERNCREGNDARLVKADVLDLLKHLDQAADEIKNRFN